MYVEWHAGGTMDVHVIAGSECKVLGLHTRSGAPFQLMMLAIEIISHARGRSKGRPDEARIQPSSGGHSFDLTRASNESVRTGGTRQSWGCALVRDDVGHWDGIWMEWATRPRTRPPLPAGELRWEGGLRTVWYASQP